MIRRSVIVIMGVKPGTVFEKHQMIGFALFAAQAKMPSTSWMPRSEAQAGDPFFILL